MSDEPAKSASDHAIEQRKRARTRAKLMSRGALAAGTVAAMSAMSPRSWWMLAALGAFGYWARSRVYAHRAHVGETLGQRSWAILACLWGEYSESELDALRMLDARVVLAIESGDLASVEPLLDEVEAIITDLSAATSAQRQRRQGDVHVVHDLRAFVLAAQGQTDAARATLRRPAIAFRRPWWWLTMRLLGDADAPGELPERPNNADFTPPMRALMKLLERPQRRGAMYRSAARITEGRVAYESWMTRVAPALSDGLVPWRASSSAMDASWNRPSTAQPIAMPKRPWRDRVRSPWALTMLSLAALQALALFKGVELVRAPTQGLVLLFLVPIVGLLFAALWSWANRREPENARTYRYLMTHQGEPARYMTKHMTRAVERLLRGSRGEDERALSSSREAFALTWALGSPRDQALVLRTHAVNLAWAGLHEESESVLARLDEDFATYSHTVAARFESRLVQAVMREDRARAAKIAREYVDTVAIDAEIEGLWKSVYAALIEPSLADEARLCNWGRSRGVRWLMALLEHEPVRVSVGEAPSEAAASEEAASEAARSEEVQRQRVL